MRPTLLVCVLLSWCTGVVGQMWCTPGAKWVYEFTGWGHHSIWQYTHTGDTLIHGRDANHVLVERWDLNAGTWNEFHEYSALENEVVLVPVTADGVVTWDTLYWFGAMPGDRWWPLYAPEECAPNGMIEVVDISTVIINGVPLRHWQLGYVDEYYEETVASFTMTERIGADPRIPHVMDCELIVDYYFSDLLCYQDNDILLQNGTCAIAQSVNEQLMPPLVLAPNPGGEGFHLFHGLDDAAHIMITDVHGRIVLRSRIRNGVMVNMRDVASGIYLVRVLDSHGAVPVARWIKE